MDLQALLEDRGAALTAPSTALHSDQLIQSWIEDVRMASNTPEAPLPSSDFLSSVDWVYGDVDQSAKVIVQGLMGKDLDVQTHQHTSKTVYDPTVAMEMRHKKVRERRVARETRQAKRRARESLTNEAHQQARELVELEEAHARERRRRDEQVIAHHMSQFRAELREKERRARLVAMETPHIRNVVVEAKQLLSDERKRQATRAELLRQLEEVETSEVKSSLKLLHSCFSQWYQVVIEGHGKMAKASAVSEWKLLVHVWGAWRRWADQCRKRREKVQTARELQRQRILFQHASDHNRVRVLSKTLRAWLGWMRRVQSERREEETKIVYKKKMDALLVAAAQRVVVVDPPHERAVDHTSPDTTRQEVTSPTKCKPHTQPTPTLKQNKPPPATVKSGPHELHSSHTKPSMWREATKEMSELLERVGAETSSTRPPHQLSASSALGKERRKPLKLTQPVSLSGMEARSTAMAQRRAARLQRQEEKKRARQEAQAKEEAERVRVEAEQRRTRETQRREERLAAKQRELEREEQRRYMAGLQQRASDHYRLMLLKRRGLLPWIGFTASMKQLQQLGDKVRVQSLVKRVFCVWKTATVQRSMARENMAIELHNQQILRKAVKLWRQYMLDCKRLEELAAVNVTRLLTGRVFRGWRRVTRDERVREWEMTRQARKCRERHLKAVALGRWVQFVPLSREERAQEQRRAELRRKVASWLQDYSPADPVR